MTLRRILVGLDGSPLAETVLEPVRRIAAPIGARLVLLHVTRVPEGVRDEAETFAVDDVITRERVPAEAYLDRIASRLPEALVAQSMVTAGDPATEIARIAIHEDVDLIALATHGRSGMSRWIYGSVADAVLHTATRPLLLLRPPAEGGPAAAAPFSRIVVPLDGSALAQAALPFAEELARALQVPILLLRTVEFIAFAFTGDPYGGAINDYRAVVDAMHEDAECHLATVATTLRAKGLRVETNVALGTPVDVITTHTREHPGSLVVMTTHGRTGWRAFVLGSVARRVALLAAGPVLLVRPQAADAGTAHDAETAPVR